MNEVRDRYHIWEFFRCGWNTQEIANFQRISEAEVYNILARRPVDDGIQSV